MIRINPKMIRIKEEMIGIGHSERQTIRQLLSWKLQLIDSQLFARPGGRALSVVSCQLSVGLRHFVAPGDGAKQSVIVVVRQRGAQRRNQPTTDNAWPPGHASSGRRIKDTASPRSGTSSRRSVWRCSRRSRLRGSGRGRRAWRGRSGPGSGSISCARRPSFRGRR